MQIRPATLEDYVPFMKLMNDFVGEDRYSHLDNDSYKTVIESPTNFIYVAEDEGTLIGLITFSIRNVVRYPQLIAELDELYVVPEYREKGLGKHLMETVEIKAKELNCHRMYIESGIRFKGAHAFYEAIGYKNYGYHFIKNL